MSIQIIRSTEQKEPRLVMTVYGPGGVGKTTLAATAPKPIFIDSEEGSKALGARGIDVPIINVKSWKDVGEAFALIKDSTDYQTVVIDPVDRFLDLLMDEVKNGGDMNLKKFGEVKDRMKRFIWAVKGCGKHVVFVAHEAKAKDDDQQLRSPLLHVNLSDELVNLCDVVGHLRVDAEGKRSLRVQPEPKYVAKDRFGALSHLVTDPNIETIIKNIHARFETKPAVTSATKLSNVANPLKS